MTLDELIGYELQKKQLVENTEGAFVEGAPCEVTVFFLSGQWNREVDVYQGNFESILRKGTPVN